MHKRKFVITLAVIIAVVGMILLMSAALKWARKWGGYIEDAEYLRGDLVKSFNSYYDKHVRYPEEFNDLPMYSYYQEHGRYPEDFRVRDLGLEILTDVNYTSDGNSFELVWKYPSSPYEDAKYTSIVTLRGLKGELTYSYTFNKSEQKRPNRIGIPFEVSPDGELLFFSIGPQWSKGQSAGRKRQIYILKQGDKIPQPISGLEEMTIWSISWHPDISLQKALLTECSHVLKRPARLFELTITNGQTMVSPVILPKDVIIQFFPFWGIWGWSPNRQIIAGGVCDLSKDGPVTLGISYDNFKNIIITDIVKGFGKVVWTDNKTLYMHADNGDILEVCVEDGKAWVTRTVARASTEDVNMPDEIKGEEDMRTYWERLHASAKYVYMAGEMNGKLVYCIDNDIFHGDQVLFHTEQDIWGLQFRTSGSFLAFKAGTCAWVLDEKGNVINQKEIGEDTILVALSSSDKFVYLVNGYQSIERYSFVGDDEINTIFHVNELE